MNDSRPLPARVFVYLALGLLAASQSGNLIRIGDAHPVAIAAWRLLMAGVLLAPFARGELRHLLGLTGREKGLLLLAGAALFFHFFTWIAAVQNTTVANASMVMSINPVFTGLASHLIFGEKITKKLVLSILIGLVGVAVIGWGDLRLERDHLVGDGLSLGSSALFTLYFLLGKRLRNKLPTAVYVSTIYTVASLFGFIALFLLGVPPWGYTPTTWLCFFLMALIPTMIGHTALNNTLRYLDASRISAATMVEPLLAGIVAYFAWSEAITGPALIGYAFIAASVLVLVLDLKPATRHP